MSLIEKTPPIYIVSGGKGLAGDAIVQSVLIHFPNNKVPVIVVPDVLTQDKMDDIISKVLQTNGVIVHTMVDSDARKMLINSCFQSGVRHIDLAGDLSDYLSNLLNTQPISVYLAMFGWKVANVPIVPGIDPPDSLFKADPKRVFGLNISPVYLIAQRANRVKSLHMDEDTAKQ
jgi:hypothetical protein